MLKIKSTDLLVTSISKEHEGQIFSNTVQISSDSLELLGRIYIYIYIYLIMPETHQILALQIIISLLGIKCGTFLSPQKITIIVIIITNSHMSYNNH